MNDTGDMDKVFKGLGLPDDLTETALTDGPRPDRSAADRIKARTMRMVQNGGAAEVGIALGASDVARARPGARARARAGGGRPLWHRSRLWWVGTAVVAAGLAAFVIVSALGHGPGAPIDPTTKGGGSSQTVAKLSEEPIRTVQMLDAQTAWATGSGVAYRTTDGGSTWTEFRYHSEDANVAPLAATALDRDHVWVVEGDTQGNSLAVWSTKDGGSSWMEANLPGKPSASLVNVDFTTATDGWLLVSGAPSLGLMSKELYHSEDGGRSWTIVASGFAGAETTGGASWLTGGMYTTGMAFQNNARGWVTGSYHGGDLIPVYRTDDGGKTWAIQTLDFPAGLWEPNTYGNGMEPIFFGPSRQDAVLPVFLRSGVVLFKSKDGGQTWSFSGSVSGSVRDAALSGVDPQHLWILGYGGGVLYRTQDGGTSWTEISVGQNLASVSFGSADTGLGLAVAGQELTLVKSIDGGMTWTALDAHVVSK